MEQFLVVVRHGDGGDSALSNEGRDQVLNLKEVIDTLIRESCGAEKRKRILFSFSFLGRAVETARGLSSCGEDVVITDLFLTCRYEIPEPQEILEKVKGIADHYQAQVTVIVAHGDMPPVIAEAAHELVTGEEYDNRLPSVGTACGYVVNMKTGEVAPISFNPPKEKSEPYKPEVKTTIIGSLTADGDFRPAGQTASSPKEIGMDDDDVPF